MRLAQAAHGLGVSDRCVSGGLRERQMTEAADDAPGSALAARFRATLQTKLGDRQLAAGDLRVGAYGTGTQS